MSKYILTLVVFVCLLVLSLCISLHIYERYADIKKPTVDIVISRYNEDINWLCDDAIKNQIADSGVKTTIYIYNKGVNNVTPEFMRCYSTIVDLHVMQLPNVGRCDHTYLYHIINHYDNIADVTIFLPASCDMDTKIYKTTTVVQKAYQDIDTVFINEGGNIYDTMKDFQLSEWKSSHTSNHIINQDPSMELADPRPFGKWYLKMFGDEARSYNYMTYFGIFAISRNDILSRSVEMYKKLISTVDKHHNPEAGHYLERSWSAVFNIPNERIF